MQIVLSLFKFAKSAGISIIIKGIFAQYLAHIGLFTGIASLITSKMVSSLNLHI